MNKETRGRGKYLLLTFEISKGLLISLEEDLKQG